MIYYHCFRQTFPSIADPVKSGSRRGIRLGTILGRFSIHYFSGLGLRIMVRVRVMVRVMARVRVWVRVRFRVGVRVRLLIWPE